MKQLRLASFLQALYAEEKCYVQEDDPTTTLESCGAVLAASVILKTSSPDAVSELTGLPVKFAEAMLDHLLLDDWLYSIDLADVVRAIHDHSDSPERARPAILQFMVNFWAETDINCLADFQDVREGRLFGGQRQWWVDEENLPMSRGQ